MKEIFFVEFQVKLSAWRAGGGFAGTKLLHGPRRQHDLDNKGERASGTPRLPQHLRAADLFCILFERKIAKLFVQGAGFRKGGGQGIRISQGQGRKSGRRTKSALTVVDQTDDIGFSLHQRQVAEGLPIVGLMQIVSVFKDQAEGRGFTEVAAPALP